MNIISSNDLTREFIEEIFNIADKFKDKASCLGLKGKILVNLFLEPSTRTRISFESAMIKLGGNVINIEDESKIAIARGETIEDTIRILENYADFIVLRYPDENLIYRLKTQVPLINAGNGSEEHPTQSLLDLYTIKEEISKIDGIRILFVGDLLYGRTIHSLIYSLSNFKDIIIYFSSPYNLKLPKKYKDYLNEKQIKFYEIKDFEKILPDIDVLYTNRIKEEKFVSQEEYKKDFYFFKIDNALLKILNKNAIIMHPLPRTKEIPIDVDKDKRAIYFNQAKNGLYVRMALLWGLLKNDNYK